MKSLKMIINVDWIWFKKIGKYFISSAIPIDVKVPAIIVAVVFPLHRKSFNYLLPTPGNIKEIIDKNINLEVNFPIFDSFLSS